MRIEISDTYSLDTVEVTKTEQGHGKLVEKLISKLAVGVAVFFYIKGDGSIRTAKGTTNPQFFVKKSWQVLEDAAGILKQNAASKEAIDLVESYIKPIPNTNRESTASNINYYDLDANAWRSVIASKLLAVFV